MIFNELSVNDAIKLYFEKHDALRRGDFSTIKKLRQLYPQLFLASTDKEIEYVLNHVDMLKRNPEFQRQYVEFCKTKAKEKFTLICNPDFPNAED